MSRSTASSKYHSIILLFLWQLQLVSCETYHFYNKVTSASLCISSSFTEVRSEAINELLCSTECRKNPRCQAFSMADGPCQLFVFDACSKSVRDCSCSRRGQVFVKQQPGLQPGALCPSGYGDDLCGVKYKLYTDPLPWQQARQKCESESGLVIMADVVDATEMDHVNMIHAKYDVPGAWLGGAQVPGSPEPAGGWSWVSCDLPINSVLWDSAEPNNDGGNTDAITKTTGLPKLNDYPGLTSLKFICECVSPFD